MRCLWISISGFESLGGSQLFPSINAAVLNYPVSVFVTWSTSVIRGTEQSRLQRQPTALLRQPERLLSGFR